MSARLRLALIVLAAAPLGAAMAWGSDQAGASRDLVSSLRNTIGSLSTPWLLIPFVAGAMCRRTLAGALIGLATTTSALTGWYLYAGIAEDVGGHGFIGDLRLEFLANCVYFAAGLLSGPLFGAAGAWWRRTRTAPSGLVAGALLIGEPLVMGTLTLLHHLGVLSADTRLPGFLSLAAHTWIADWLAGGVLAGEFLLGVLVALLARRVARRRTAPAGD